MALTIQLSWVLHDRARLGSMTTTRIRIEFDLDVHDEAAARVIARDFIVEQLEMRREPGGRIEMSHGTVKESADAAVQAPEALASVLALTALARGAMQTPSISISNPHSKPLGS